MSKNTRQVFFTILLAFAALIWGSAFVAQSIGAQLVGPFTFLALRSWIAVMMMVLMLLYKRYVLKKPSVLPHLRFDLRGGFFCALFLFLASLLQQIGIAYTTTAKAGFITAMYVVLVPVMTLFMGQKISKRIWFSVFLGVIGLYLLSMTGGFSLQLGDALVLLCAFLFSFQILAVSRYALRTDPIVLSLLQFFFTALFSTVFMFIFEGIDIPAIKAASGSILYAGVLSSGVAYTIQTITQRELDPTIASLTMSLESVFAALTGWLVLHETLSTKELLGCVIMFTAIILSQLPEKKPSVEGSR